MPPKSTKGKKSGKEPKSSKPTVEKLSDITDEVDDEPAHMSDSDAEDTVAEVDPDADADDTEEMPVLEAVSMALKEKYEYKPLQRVKTVYVRPKDRITSEVMTKFEYAEVISIRAKHIEDGDQPFTDVGDLQDPIDMAKKEIADKKCPLSIVRNRTFEGDTTIAELWQVNEMAIPYD